MCSETLIWIDLEGKENVTEKISTLDFYGRTSWKNWERHIWTAEAYDFLEMEVGDPACMNTLKKAYL